MLIQADIVTEAKAKRITALQRGFTSRSDEREILQLIKSCRGESLTRLKLAIDSGPDHSDLVELLYHDVDNEAIRAEILDHIRRESPERKDSPPVRIISDIDDTLYSSLNDPRFLRGTMYPGLAAFHQELAKLGDEDQSRVLDLILLTARPRDGLGLVERFTKRNLHLKGFQKVVILSGSVFSLRSHRAMAEYKLKNFRLYQELYPEFDFLFIGDSGQGDIVLGESLIREFPSRVRCVLIHNLDGNFVQTENVKAFQTYLGAALDLHDLGLLNADHCHRIAEAVKNEMKSAGFRSKELEKQILANLMLDLARLPSH